MRIKNKELMTTTVLPFIFLLTLNCKQSTSPKSLAEPDYATKIIQKYSHRSLNYFYEVAFYSETDNTFNPLRRWKGNVAYFIQGDTLKGDLQFVRNSIRKLNALKLPVRFTLTNNIVEADITIYFGDSIKLTSMGLIPGALGMGTIHSSHTIKGIIESAKILILNNPKELKRRESTILEEMTQVLGIYGDSFRYPESIFYEGINYSTNFTFLDNQVLNILYDSLMPLNCTINQFESDFASILNYVNTTEKLKAYIADNKINFEILDEIKQSCYIENEFYKHPNDISVFLSGFDHYDSGFLKKAILALNKLSPNLVLQLRDSKDQMPSSGISLNLFPNATQDFPTETRIKNRRGVTFKPKRIESVVNITYKPEIDSTKKFSVILKAIYKSLGPTEIKKFDADWFKYDGKEIVFSKKYSNMLKLIYQEEFVDGYPINEFIKLLD